MAEEEQFVSAILAAPREDTLRLVFADWLDERAGPGDAARAEFIRLGVAHPEALFWASDGVSVVEQREPGRAANLFAVHWKEWVERLRTQLGTSPLARWLDRRPDCTFAYRRGFVSVFHGTQQVILDAWTDLFRLGPIEEVSVSNLWHFGTVTTLRTLLDRPSARAINLWAQELREDCVERIQQVVDWFRRLERVELRVTNPQRENARALRAWFAERPSLSHVQFVVSAV